MTWDELDWATLDRLRDGFLNGAAADGPYWKSEDDLAHYDHTYAERIGWKWDHVLTELQRRGWSPPPGHLLDWGCGSGIASRRVLAHWPATLGDTGAAQFFDHSVLAENVAQRRLRETIPSVRTQSWDRAAPIGTLLISHVLNELDADSTAELREAVHRAEAVIWIEPGTSDVAGKLVVWRNALRERFRILYPCTHANECGMFALENARHWCHHFAVPPPFIFADSHWVKFGQRAGIDLRKLVELVALGPVNSGLFQAMAKTLDGQMDGLKFELDNARKDVRYYTHLAENQGTPSIVGEAVHQSLALASALGHGRKFVPSLVEAQEQLAHVKVIPR